MTTHRKANTSTKRKDAALRNGVLPALVVILFLVSIRGANAEDTSTFLVPGDIDTCGAIETPGEYTLNASIDATGIATCFEVSVGNVTITGNGHRVFANGLGEGVYAHGKQGGIANVIVRDITFEDLDTGVHYMNVVDGEITDATLANHTTAGISLAGTSTKGTIIDSNSIFGNGRGISILQGVTDTTITRNTIENDSEAAIKIMGASGNTITDNKIRGHSGEKAIHITSRSPNNLLERNLIERNLPDPANPLSLGPEYALQISGESSNTTIRDNIVRDNGRGGITVGSVNGTVVDNDVSGNGGNGIDITAAGITVADNAIHDNTGSGLVLQSTGTIALRNEIHANGNTGALLVGAQGAVIANSTIDDNLWDITDTLGTGNTIENIAIDANTTITAAGEDYSLRAVTTRPADPENHSDIGRFVEANGTSPTGNVAITIHYDQQSVAGKDEYSLRLWRYAAGNWSPLSGAGEWHYDLPTEAWIQSGVNEVDTTANTVFAHVAEWGILAPLDGTVIGDGLALSVENASINETDVNETQPVLVTATILNGGASAIAVRVDVTAGPMTVATQSITLEPNASTAVAFDTAFPVGTHEIRVSGAFAGNLTVHALDTERPKANAGGNRTATPGSTIAFTAAGSTDNIGIVSYAWDLDGDNVTDATTMDTNRTYTATGVYVVTLTVLDAAGLNGTDSIAVTVAEPAVPPVTPPANPPVARSGGGGGGYCYTGWVQDENGSCVRVTETVQAGVTNDTGEPAAPGPSAQSIGAGGNATSTGNASADTNIERDVVPPQEIGLASALTGEATAAVNDANVGRDSGVLVPAVLASAALLAVGLAGYWWYTKK